MPHKLCYINYVILISIFILFLLHINSHAGEQNMITDIIKIKTINKLVELYGESQKTNIEKGVNQVATFWKKEDGSEKDFYNFCINNFISDEDIKIKTLNRIEANLEIILGNYNRISRELLKPIHLDIGELYPIDYMFAEFSPETHFYDDLFNTKIAFLILLNYPIYTLEEKISLSIDWLRLDWAKARLADLIISRVPYEIQQKQVTAYLKAEDYISNYNIFMNNIIYNNKKDLFPKGLKLIAHWGLRDELKSHYAEEDGLIKQEAIFQIMEHIINQTIPICIINNEKIIWDINTNKIYSLEDNKETNCPPEVNIRYKNWLDIFKSEKETDQYYPTLPTLIDRRFKKQREIPEKKARQLFESILTSPSIPKIAKIIEKKLGRKLRPFDIWYSGFASRASYNEAALDKIISEKYPNTLAFQKDLVNILLKMDFDKENATFISKQIIVDPSRGAGHAMGARTKDDKAHLRTRIPQDGMKYKGYNIATHEFGHNVEQVISLHNVDHYLLTGVPNTAFTEAAAYIFQKRDLKLLGIQKSEELNKEYDILNTLLQTYEIIGVSLVDMDAWHWLYEHPNATENEFKTAVINIAKNIWNKYYAPIFKIQDQDILAIYSHMIDAGLYLPDYPLGHIISFQIEKYMEDKPNLADEFIRIYQIGSILPDEWMKSAVGQPISTEPLLKAAEDALNKIKK